MNRFFFFIFLWYSTVETMGVLYYNWSSVPKQPLDNPGTVANILAELKNKLKNIF